MDYPNLSRGLLKFSFGRNGEFEEIIYEDSEKEIKSAISKRLYLSPEEILLEDREYRVSGGGVRYPYSIEEEAVE
ncbi:MAG: hypothetical protein ACLFQK_02155 [Fibrobacterota bacterium]